jgi:hypothetical protein
MQVEQRGSLDALETHLWNKRSEKVYGRRSSVLMSWTLVGPPENVICMHAYVRVRVRVVRICVYSCRREY